MTIAKTQELDDFCQILIQGLHAMKRANEMPSYMATKARDINVIKIEKALQEQLETVEVLQQFKAIEGRRQICSEDEFRTKDSILTFAKEVKPVIDRLKSANFKLMLDRFVDAHEFAIKLSELVDDLT